MKSLTTRVLTATAFMLGAFALAVAAGTWTAPTTAPPGGNVDAPINVGTGLQTKEGSLWVKGGINVDGNLLIATGTPGVGKVLTTVDNLGTVKWQAGSPSTGQVLTALDSLGTVGWQTPATITRGTLCGSLDYDPGGTNRSVPCGGVTLTLTSGSGLTAVGTCPSGYTFTSVSYISGHDYYSCVKN